GRLGFIYEPGHKRPVGTSERERPVALVGLNCATCHVATVRDAPGAPRRFILGAPATWFDGESYLHFLIACARDPRFDADHLIAAIEADDPGFGPVEKLLYRFMVIPKTRKQLV